MTVRDDWAPSAFPAGTASVPTPTGPTRDWAADGRRERLLLPAAVLVLGGSRLLLTGHYAGLDGTAAWAVLVAAVGLAAAVPLAAAVLPGVRRWQADEARVLHALRAHVDPGPRLRSRADVRARRAVRLHWTGRVMPVLPATLLLQGRWDSPDTAVPAAVVLVVGYAALVVWNRRHTLAAARWITDRPGPLRAVPPPPWWEKWLDGRHVLALTGGYVALVVAVTVVMGG